MQHNQVFLIQVSSGAASSKPPLALPPAGPDSTVLPSEVKYSASLVRGLGLAHLFLGCVVFLLGVLGTWIEPETCWAGAGVWTGLAALLCGLSGLVAHCFWYKNFSIKAFLVTSVVCVVLSVLAIVLSIYAIVNRHKHFQTLLEQMDEHSWFQPYDLNQEHRLTLNISANLLVGFFLELGLALWSSRVGWRGVQTPEFSASNRDLDAVDQCVTPLPPRSSQQVPLAALYQLLQAHPEMLGNKSLESGLVPPWMSSGLGDHPTHHSMDYQERVNRFLSHAIEDQNPCLSRPLSALLSENRDSSSTATSSGGRCSPADTLPMPPPDQAPSGGQRRETMEREIQERYTSSERKTKQTHSETHSQKDTGSERKVKQTHVDKLPNGHPSSERKMKETHVDTLSNGHNSSERKVKQRHADKLPNGDTSSERKVKETHVDTLSNSDSTRERKVKETHVDTLSNGHNSSERKVKQRRADKLPNGDTSSERKVKETHVDTLLNGDSTSERKVKETHVDTLPNGHTSSERKVKETHVDTLPNGDTSSGKKVKEIHADTLSNGHTSSGKVKETHVDTLRSRRGSEHKPKAPVPKVKTNESETSNKGSVKDESISNVEVAVEKSHKEEKSEVQSEISPVVDKEENISREDMTKSITEVTDPNVHSKKADKAEKHKKKKSKRASESSNQEKKPKSNTEKVNGHVTENTDTYKSEERKARKERKENRKKENKGDEKPNDSGNSADLLVLASSIQPPCEFQDT